MRKVSHMLLIGTVLPAFIAGQAGFMAAQMAAPSRAFAQAQGEQPDAPGRPPKPVELPAKPVVPPVPQPLAPAPAKPLPPAPPAATAPVPDKPVIVPKPPVAPPLVPLKPPEPAKPLPPPATAPPAAIPAVPGENSRVKPVAPPRANPQGEPVQAKPAAPVAAPPPPAVAPVIAPLAKPALPPAAKPVAPPEAPVRPPVASPAETGGNSADKPVVPPVAAPPAKPNLPAGAKPVLPPVPVPPPVPVLPAAPVLPPSPVPPLGAAPPSPAPLPAVPPLAPVLPPGAKPVPPVATPTPAPAAVPARPGENSALPPVVPLPPIVVPPTGPGAQPALAAPVVVPSTIPAVPAGLLPKARLPVNPPRQDRGISPSTAAVIGLGAGLVGGFIAGNSVRQYDDVRRQRQEVDASGFTIYREPGRNIIRENDVYFIQHDETQRFRDLGGDIKTYRRDNTLVTTFRRADGDEIITITDANGRLLRRVKHNRDGRDIVLIDNTYEGPERSYADEIVLLPPPPLEIPADRYIVDADNAPEGFIYETLTAPPVAPLSRRYTLDQVRASPDLRNHMRSVDVTSVNFETASFEVTPDQAGRLATIAQALLQAIKKQPNEVFLIEGYTDAVGSDVDNLSLSDRRAQSVATLLTQTYSVPPENLATQGFGKQNLKVKTNEAARENRRVTVRRITPLLNGPQAQK